MTPNELASQLEFFKDIGVDDLDLGAYPYGRGSSEAGGEGQMAPALVNIDTLDTIRLDIGDCQRCKLAPTRTNIVFGSGNPTPNSSLSAKRRASTKTSRVFPSSGAQASC